jgi:RNA polymerase sigma-B factor
MVDRAAIRQLLEELPGRERKIIYLRFFEHMSQAEIAARVGTSQVHVGRLLQSSLTKLRAHITSDEAIE